MALKRKRSSPAFSSPVSYATAHSDTSSPNALPFFYAQSKPVEPLYQKPSWAYTNYDSDDSYATSRHLNSRTRKRHRDDRPDEKSIFASTISRLYQAQRHLAKVEPMSSPMGTIGAAGEHSIQTSTLHSFWKIGSSAPNPSGTMRMDSGSSPATSMEMRCEDCEDSLRRDDAMDLDDGMLNQETACAFCRRRVCDGCAVLGNQRVCLACASRS